MIERHVVGEDGRVRFVAMRALGGWVRRVATENGARKTKTLKSVDLKEWKNRKRWNPP
jgi:hypothetical protein